MAVWVIQNPWLVIGIALLYVGFAGYVFIQISIHGDDHWLWIPMIILLAPISIPAYFIMRIRNAREEKGWVERSIKADEFKRSHNPRKLKTEAELREAYNKSKAQRHR